MPQLAVPARTIGMRARISMVWLWTAAALLLSGCGDDYREEERETGYRGKARLDPFLAAERFLRRLGHDVRVDRSWPQVDRSTGTMMMPAAMLEAKGYVDEVRDWVRRGGHLICFFSWTSAARNEWRAYPEAPTEPSAELKAWMEDAGWRVLPGAKGDAMSVVIAEKAKDGNGKQGTEPEMEEWTFKRRSFLVRKLGPELFEPLGREGTKEEGRRFVSVPYGGGRLTLVADARPFRNRSIGEADHAPLLAALVMAARPGAVIVVLGTDVSFWHLVWTNGWTVLVALGALALVWLWRSLPRFGPLEASVRVDDWRDYRRHLDAVGGFFWRTDRGQSLLAPLRQEVMERLRQRRAVAGAESDLIVLAGTIADVPQERVRAALDETLRHDSASFTRVTGDLQRLLERL